LPVSPPWHALGFEDFKMSRPEIKGYEGTDGQLLLSHSFFQIGGEHKIFPFLLGQSNI